MRVIVKNDGTIGKIITGQYDYTDGKELFYPVGHGRYCEKQLDLLEDIEYREGTEEDYLEYIKQDFPWGQVVKIHNIGEYQIIEYINSGGEFSFHTYINYESTSRSYETLEKAITGVIVYKYDGANSQVNYFLWKVIE